LHLLIEVDDGRSEAELIRSALEHGVKVYPVAHGWLSDKPQKPARPRILLGFGGLSLGAIEEGVRVLREAWFA
jgi:GntR family transcriptional regulator/MocR family aminotransferase